jgi:hypothetical protein
MLGDPALELAQPVPLGELRGELHAELRLAARPAQEHHEPARDGQREVASQVLLDQLQRQVHPGRDPGRGVHAAVADEDRIALDAHGGKPALQRVARRPVCDGAPAVQHPGLGQQEGAAADRGDASSAPGGAPDPRDEPRVAHVGPGAGPAGDDQRVDGTSGPGEAAVGHERQPSRGRDRPGRRGHQRQRVARRPGIAHAVDDREHLPGAGDVERLGVGEREHPDAPRPRGRHQPQPHARRPLRHDARMPRRPRGRNAIVMANPAMPSGPAGDAAPPGGGVQSRRRSRARRLARPRGASA